MTYRAETYETVLEQLEGILVNNTDPITAMVTINSLLKYNFDEFYWVGFYRMFDTQLVVGPYQGTLGCLYIPIGKGVCGTSAANQQTLIVKDVDKFPGHIACDPLSKSEIVIPVFDKNREVRAVLDIDSDKPDNFSDIDKSYLERIVTRHLEHCYS